MKRFYGQLAYCAPGHSARFLFYFPIAEANGFQIMNHVLTETNPVSQKLHQHEKEKWFCSFCCIIFWLLKTTSPSNCVQGSKHHHGRSQISGTKIGEATSGLDLHSARFKGLSDGVRGQQCSDEAHHGGIQLLHGLPCTADCRA